jgi:glutamate/tyrosine decarboxylase-like PLP-dependent enzyme
MSLDPENWDALRVLGHRMVDDMFDHLADLREQPVWRPMPDEARAALRVHLPRAEASAEDVYAAFRALVMPYGNGNTHPRFMGWVHGGGNPVGMLAEFLAAGLNSNLGGRDHAPIEVERQVIRWSAEMLGMPPESSGVLVTGTSMANMIGLLVARGAKLGASARQTGLAGRQLTAYASAGAHGCIARAMDMAGIGTDALRLVPCDENFQMRPQALQDAIAHDMEAGATPFLVVGTAGSVDTGAIDDLRRCGDIARASGLWFHVDAAFGAMAALSPHLRGGLDGIEAADSVAFDFHKWMQVPYDAGCIVVRDAAAHQASFAQQLSYLRRSTRGLAGGHPWPCDFGPDLSRGFRALKVWMTFNVYGADRLAAVVENSCAVAQALAKRVRAEPALELMAPVALNIVCFCVRGADDVATTELVAALQEQGIAAPSTTVIAGRTVIRAAIVNHRTTEADAEALVDAVLRLAPAFT